MKAKKNMAGAGNPLKKLHRKTSLTVKMVFLTVVAGLSIWTVFDLLHTHHLKNLFNAQLTEELNTHTGEDYQIVNNYIKTYYESGTLFTTQKNFSDYIEGISWREAGAEPVKHHRLLPRWAPERSILQTFIQPQHVVLLDPKGKTREVWSPGKGSIPSALLRPTNELMEASLGKGLLTVIEETPYIITSSNYRAQENETLATLLLASRLDNNFLHDALGHIDHDHTVVLLSLGKEPTVLASCNNTQLPAGVPFNALKDVFMSADSSEPLSNSSTDLEIAMTTLMDMREVNRLLDNVVTSERKERAMVALTLITVFALIMYWITSRINDITFHVTYFSEKFMGIKPMNRRNGDQLHTLKEQFHELTKEVMETRRAMKTQAEEKTRLIVESAFDAIATTDDNGMISSWNPTAESLFGWSSEEAIGRPIQDVIVPDIHKDFREPIKSIITDHKGHEFRRKVILTTYHRNGHEIPVEFSVSSAEQDNGQVLIFIMRDTTERSRNEKRIQQLLATLTKTKEEWEKTFDTVTEQIILVDKDLNLIRCNKSFAKAMRSSLQDLIGRKYDEFMLCDKSWLSGIKSGQEQAERTEIMTHDGRWLYVSTLPVHDRNSIFMYTIITATDITELKKTQQDLIKSKQELDERVEELENFYDMAVNREIKMIKLKEEVTSLKKSSGSNNSVIEENRLQEAPNSAYIFNKNNQNLSQQPRLSFLDDNSV